MSCIMALMIMQDSCVMSLMIMIIMIMREEQILGVLRDIIDVTDDYMEQLVI